MCMLDKIHARRDEIRAIARRHKAEKLWVFGSVARKEESPESDIDLVAEFLPGTSLLSHARLEDELARFFGCGVDVCLTGPLTPDRGLRRSSRRIGSPYDD